MAQTAVEWLIEKLDVVDSSIMFVYIEQAKEMEKQQQGYSEEELNSIFYAICKHSFFEDNVETVYLQDVKDEFEQFKKK